MKKDNPRPGRSTKEIRSLFGQIKGAENQRLATRAFIVGMAGLHYAGLILDRDPEDLTGAEEIERSWFTRGLNFETDDYLGLATEMLDEIARKQHN